MMIVELNPRLLGSILGEEIEDVKRAMTKLCSPDPDSRTKEEDGRRLVEVGPYLYRVVNGLYYRAIRNEEDRRAQSREAQERFRLRKKARRRSSQQPGDGLVRHGMDPSEAADMVNREMAENRAGLFPTKTEIAAAVPDENGVAEVVREVLVEPEPAGGDYDPVV